jgi:tetratricopeptide (TPR) repeat protein
MNRLIGTALVAATIGAGALMAQQGKKGPAAPTGPTAKSQNELKALQAVFTASQQNNPDGVITAAEDLLSKFKDTDFKDTVLMMEAQAYQQKGDKDKATIYAERALAANPNDFQAALMLADLTVQGTREHDLDRDEKLAKADKYANQAITAVTAAEKPNPQLTDQQWADYKKDTISQAHDALGMSAIDRKDYDKAISELKMAVEGAAHPEPAYQVRLASAYQSAGKNDEAIALAEKIMNDSQVPQQIRSVAQSVRASAMMAKNGGKPANQNTPPPQVEINRKE